MSETNFCTRRGIANDWRESINSSRRWERQSRPVSCAVQLILVKSSSNANLRQETLEARFERLANQWDDETAFLSSATSLVLNSAYQQIIGMGPAVLPLILRHLDFRGGHWFWALKHISGEDPIALKDAGDYEKMREAWLKWGREHHYL